MLTGCCLGCQETLENMFDYELTDIPKNAYTANQIFSTPEGVETAVNGMYFDLQAFDYYGARFHLLVWPHSGKYHSNQTASQDATSLMLQNTNSNLDKLWAGMYKTINTVNVVIRHLKKSTVSNRDFAIGQAYFLRGLTYFNLVRLFGEVPLRTVPTTVNDLNIPKSSKEQIISQVLKDFTKAKRLLPDRGEYLPGRPLKYAANAYLAITYMWIAGREQDDAQYLNEEMLHTEQILNFWEAAKKELDTVILKGGYSLTPRFEMLFNEGSENTSESIFELQYGHTGAVKSSALIRDVSLKNSELIPLGTQAFGRVNPNKEMFSDHVIQYSGKKYKNFEFIPAGKSSNKLKLNDAIADPRIKRTYLFNGYVQTTNQKNKNLFPVVSGKSRWAHVFLNKYPDHTYNSTTQSRNFILLRYADILLRRAEVENELTGPTKAFSYVNKVLARARTVANGYTKYPADWSIKECPDKKTFRARIMKEREFELNGEGHEWFDMRRRGLRPFIEQVKHHNRAVKFYKSNGGGSAGDFIYHHPETQMLMPIPLSETSANSLINN